jgi:membrane fusion protein (multidrug efflux system)
VLYAPFETGDRIRRGQLLIRTDAELDESRIEVLESQLEAARREARRLEKLVRKGLATPQQLDQARTQVEQLELNIEQAKIGLTKSRVYAPVRGHLVRKFVDDGEFVGPGAPVAEIVDYSTIEVHVAVPESQIRYVREGTSLEVHFHALDRTVDAEVSDRALLPDAKTRTYSVEVRVPNEEREILPGMRATVRIVREVLDETLVIPRDAVLQGVHRNEVIIVEQKSESEDSGVARVRPVDLGPGRGPKVVALSGLEADALLVTRGHRGLVEGTRVQIVERQPAGELAEKSTGDTSTGTPAPNLQARDAQDRDTPDGDDAAAGDAAASGGKAKSAPGGDE